MLRYEAYVHVDNQIKIKRWFGKSGIDQKSSFVSCYLGCTHADNSDDALEKFKIIRKRKSKPFIFDLPL